jgi:hypothetical protein
MAAALSAALATGGALATRPAASAAAPSRPAASWSASWSSAPPPPVPSTSQFGPNWSTTGFSGQTIRQTIRLSSGGSRVRIRLSSQYGTGPLHVTGATIAETSDGAAVQAGTMHRLTFDRARSVTIPAGQITASDAAALPVTPLESLTITLDFAGATGPSTFHEDGLTTSYRASGDHLSDTGAGAFASPTSPTSPAGGHQRHLGQPGHPGLRYHSRRHRQADHQRIPGPDPGRAHTRHPGRRRHHPALQIRL